MAYDIHAVLGADGERAIVVNAVSPDGMRRYAVVDDDECGMPLSCWFAGEGLARTYRAEALLDEAAEEVQGWH